MRRWLYLAVGMLLVAVVWLARPPATVEVTRPVIREVREVVVVSGRLQARRVSRVGFDSPGVVARVHARRGERVSAGQLLLSLDAIDAVLAVREAEARARTARAELDRLLAGPPAEEVERARLRWVTARRAGERQLEAARQRLTDLVSGRSETLRAAQAALDQARASLESATQTVRAQEHMMRIARAQREAAEAELRRAEGLFAAGALAAVVVDQARERWERLVAEEQAAGARLEAERARSQVAREQVRVAEEQLRIARRPASDPQVNAARAELESLRARVAAEVQEARLALELLSRSPRPEEVRVAEARYREAREAIRSARERLAKTALRAPFAALVVDVLKEEGTPVVPGEPVVTLADVDALEVVVDLDEENLPRLRLGQRATLVAPGSTDPLPAVLTHIDPQVEPDRGTARVRIRPLALPNFARIGMTLDVSLEVGAWSRALAVRRESVVQAGSSASVMVIREGRVAIQTIRLLGKSDRWVAVEGLTPTDLVVLDPTWVRPGQRVRWRESAQ